MIATEASMRQLALRECWHIYKRARRTIGCNDCKAIPKSARAGMVVAAESPYQVMHNGIMIRLGGYHGAWMTEIILALGGHHEPQEERIFYEVLKVMPSKATMIEAGSYWAYYSLWFKNCVSDGRIYMVEPVPHKLQIGIDNFRLNGMLGHFRNAFVGAVSNENGQFADWDGSVSRVPCIAIDDFLAREGIEFLDILHADIQGAELEMLEGCKRSLAGNRIGYLFISTHAGKHSACRDVVRRAGYQLVAEHSIAESCSGDGLIVARSKRSPQIPAVEITKKGGHDRVRENLAALMDLVAKKESRRLWKAVRAGR
jgi:FkbM family methyltransferase